MSNQNDGQKPTTKSDLNDLRDEIIDGVAHLIGGVNNRLDKVEDRLNSVETQLGKMDLKLDATIDRADDHGTRIAKLEQKLA